MDITPPPLSPAPDPLTPSLLETGRRTDPGPRSLLVLQEQEQVLQEQVLAEQVLAEQVLAEQVLVEQVLQEQVLQEQVLVRVGPVRHVRRRQMACRPAGPKRLFVGQVQVPNYLRASQPIPEI